MTHDGRLKHEIRRRLAMAHDALKPYRSKIFSNPRISVAKRVRLLQSTALAALTYNSGTWPRLNASEQQLWTNGVMRLYKTVFSRVFSAEQQFHMTSDQILALTGLPSPEFLLAFQRVLQFGQYLQRHCDYFWALVGQDQAWLELVREDLCMMYSQVQGFTVMPSPRHEEALDEWQEVWQRQPKKVVGIFKRARAHHVGQTKLRFEVAQFHEKIYEILHRAGLRHQYVEASGALTALGRFTRSNHMDGLAVSVDCKLVLDVMPVELTMQLIRVYADISAPLVTALPHWRHSKTGRRQDRLLVTEWQIRRMMIDVWCHPEDQVRQNPD